jgi:galactonate dehydratase
MTARIRSVEAVVVDGGMRNWVFVHVDTDDGLRGLGEATLEGKAETVVGAISDFSRLLVGEDASRIQHLWQTLYRGSFWRGGPALMSAISGIEQALWDLAGKRAGLPVHELLGGACREVVRLYANGPRGETPEEYAASARAIVAQGFDALKVAPLEPTLPVDGTATIRRATEVVAAIRDAVGRDVAVAVDVHGRLSPAMSIRLARELEPLDVWFLEEPVLPENPRALADVARATSIPIATGERLFTRWGFREVVELRAAALLQPDVSHCGGLLEARTIAALGELVYAGLAPHNPLSPVNTVASAHVALASPNFVACEWVVDGPAWVGELLTEPLTIAGGVLSLPRRPGLGIELDLERCREHPYRPSDLPAFRHRDGSVADW